MSLKIIVSYDDTDNDRDALALGRFLAQGAGSLALAYVRHAQQSDSEREALAEKEAQALLEHGANLLDSADVPRHVIVHASTGDGLRELALREGADIVVFGSDYRTALHGRRRPHRHLRRGRRRGAPRDRGEPRGADRSDGLRG